MKVFSGSSNKHLAEKIARALNLYLSPIEIFIFPDGERRIQIQTEVVDEDVVIVQSTANPVDINYMELFFIADALKRSGAREITLVMPYVGYQRQDHVFRSGEAVSMQVIIKMLEALGINKLICLDLHALRIQELFQIPLTHLSALPLFAQEIKKLNLDGLDSVLVSPDMGGIRRIKKMSQLLSDMPFATIVKNRDLDTGNVEMADVKGEITHRALIVDDMVSSGKTIAKAAEALKAKGAEEIYVFITHPIFSEDAPQILQKSLIEKIYVTDSVHVPHEKHFPKLHILSVAEMVAGEIKGENA